MVVAEVVQQVPIVGSAYGKEIFFCKKSLHWTKDTSICFTILW